jgi:hypothetical protein
MMRARKKITVTFLQYQTRPPILCHGIPQENQRRLTRADGRTFCRRVPNSEGWDTRNSDSPMPLGTGERPQKKVGYAGTKPAVGRFGGYWVGGYPMSRADYFRRQADTCLRLSLISSSEEVTNRLVVMAQDLPDQGRCHRGRVKVATRGSDQPPDDIPK